MKRRPLDHRIDPTDANICIDVAALLEKMSDAVNDVLWNSWPIDPGLLENIPKFKALIELRDKAERLLKLKEGGEVNHYEISAALVRNWMRDNCPDVEEKELEDLVQRIAALLKDVATRLVAFE